jgi:hypothetical protein
MARALAGRRTASGLPQWIPPQLTQLVDANLGIVSSLRLRVTASNPKERGLLSGTRQMADTNPARAISVVKRVEMMCDFIEHPAIKIAVEQSVPVSMPRLPGALGFDIALWVGLGTVGLWAALDAFAERAGLPRSQCPTCKRLGCISPRFARYTQGNESQSLNELEDLRHLYAHNYAGEADAEYFARKRHVLVFAVAQLTCGAQFDGRRLSLDLSYLRKYASTAQSLLERFP